MNESQKLAVAQCKALVEVAFKAYAAAPTHDNQKKYARACDMLYAAIYWPRDTLTTNIEYKRLEDHLPEHEEEE